MDELDPHTCTKVGRVAGDENCMWASTIFTRSGLQQEWVASSLKTSYSYINFHIKALFKTNTPWQCNAILHAVHNVRHVTLDTSYIMYM